jgi:DNA helicase-2/ATP-dependent DNA helicase PcrA
VRNLLDFERHFAGAGKLALEQNYRSRQPILDVANAVIARAERAYPKVLFSDRKHGEPVTLVECDTSEDETHFVLETTRAALSQGMARRDVAVLYRSNALARPLEEAFRLAGVPCRLVGGTAFYDRREVKDLLAYLRLALSPHDDVAFRRVVNYPARGIGDASFERLERHARARGTELLDAARSAGTIADLDERARRGIAGFVSLLDITRERLEAGWQLAEAARAVASAVGLQADIVDAGPTPAIAARRWGNVEELFRTLQKAASLGTGDARQLLARLSLRFADDHDEAAHDKVTLSTLHGAKGLEFALVFLVGCDEGILPHARTNAPKATDIAATIDAGEERRLFYVGVTRAKDRLYLLRARQRAQRGSARATLPSRFLADIPPGSLERRTYTAQTPLAPVDLAAQARSAREALQALVRSGRGVGERKPA